MALPVALIIRIGVCDIGEWYLVFYVYTGVSEVLKMPKAQWNVIVCYTHSLVCDAIGRRHGARFMPKGEWFCGVLCILGIPPSY